MWNVRFWPGKKGWPPPKTVASFQAKQVAAPPEMGGRAQPKLMAALRRNDEVAAAIFCTKNEVLGEQMEEFVTLKMSLRISEG